MANTSKFQFEVDHYRDRVNHYLERSLPDSTTFPEELHQAMRYSVLGGGKRVRPLLTYACGAALNLDFKLLDAAATAVELIHAFSLVHDDLPAMDDDDLRRGRPTTHIQFNEATAILAGDALQALAFEVIASDEALVGYPLVQSRMIKRLASAAGSIGMTGGQAQDLMAEGKQLTLQELEQMHSRKTGYLIRAAIMMACDAAPNLDISIRNSIDTYANHIGLAFQVCDDILDVEGTTEELGKPQGSDLESSKATYPSILGMGSAKEHLNQLYSQALSALDTIDMNDESLRWMAQYIAQRNH